MMEDTGMGLVAGRMLIGWLVICWSDMTGSSWKLACVEVDSSEITEGVYSTSSDISAIALSSMSSPYNS